MEPKSIAHERLSQEYDEDARLIVGKPFLDCNYDDLTKMAAHMRENTTHPHGCCVKSKPLAKGAER